MVLNQDVVRKAHEELDAVIDRDRLPKMSDKPFLPYISAIIKEVLRWSPSTPLCLSLKLSDGFTLPLIVLDFSACSSAHGGRCL
jgi:cytochrome P450